MFGLFAFMGHTLNYLGIAAVIYTLRMQKLEKEGKDTTGNYVNIIAIAVALAWPFLTPFLVVATILTYKDAIKLTWTPDSNISSMEEPESAFDELRS